MATYKLPIPEKKMANRFIGSKSKKTVTFMDKELEISKLTINQVLNVQKVTKEAEASESGNILILTAVVRAGAEELRDLSQEDIQDFPMEELATLSNSIMEYSGLTQKVA